MMRITRAHKIWLLDRGRLCDWLDEIATNAW